jgi:DNA-binding winged helix-turn-helix (wHTH) protein/TolB-like protein
MSAAERWLLVSGDLSVCPERGEVRNARGETVRLGPVNMKVLEVLMSRPGEVVSRAEIYDAVWRNQLVGDDTLTRSISDIRSEIGRLSGHRGLIETLPKRGYRWTAEVRRAAADPLEGGSAPSAQPESRPSDEGPAALEVIEPASAPRRWLVLARRIGLYALVLVLAASGAVWIADRLARPGAPIVAVLPVAAAPEQRELATAVERQIATYLVHFDRVKLLAPSAVESRPTNPFPYFAYEFGASWLIEGEIRRVAPNNVLTIDIVDARTGIVLAQSTAVVGDDPTPAALDVGAVTRALAAFFESHDAR